MKNLDPGGLTYNPWAFGDGLAPGIRYIRPGYFFFFCCLPNEYFDSIKG